MEQIKERNGAKSKSTTCWICKSSWDGKRLRWKRRWISDNESRGQWAPAIGGKLGQLSF